MGEMPEGQRGREAVHDDVMQRTRRGTPLWLPRCGVGYAKRTSPPNIAHHAEIPRPARNDRVALGMTGSRSE